MRSIFFFGWKLNTDGSLKDLNRSNVIGLYQELPVCIKNFPLVSRTLHLYQILNRHGWKNIKDESHFRKEQKIQDTETDARNENRRQKWKQTPNQNQKRGGVFESADRLFWIQKFASKKWFSVYFQLSLDHILVENSVPHLVSRPKTRMVSLDTIWRHLIHSVHSYHRKSIENDKKDLFHLSTPTSLLTEKVTAKYQVSSWFQPQENRIKRILWYLWYIWNRTLIFCT